MLKTYFGKHHDSYDYHELFCVSRENYPSEKLDSMTMTFRDNYSHQFIIMISRVAGNTSVGYQLFRVDIFPVLSCVPVFWKMNEIQNVIGLNRVTRDVYPIRFRRYYQTYCTTLQVYDFWKIHPTYFNIVIFFLLISRDLTFTRAVLYYAFV